MKFRALTITALVLFTSFSPLAARCCRPLTLGSHLWVDNTHLTQLVEDNHWEVVEISPPQVSDLSCSISISGEKFSWSSQDMDINVHVTSSGQCS